MTIRIGILSFAHLHAEAYIQNLRAMPAVEFIGFADEDGERGKQYAAQFNARLFDSYEALLQEKPDGVVICSENSRHAPLALLAASAGVHVLSEKPLATTLEDAQAMLTACQQAGVKLMTAFPMRFSTPLLEVKKLLENDSLGRIYAFNATNQGECPKHHRAWFVDKTLAGGGALMDHIVHLADVMRWYLNSEVTEVFAESNHILYKEETEVETGGLVMLTFANGVFASIDCSWNKPPYYTTWGGLAFDVVAEKGLATVNAFKQNLTVYRHSVGRGQLVGWGSDANHAMLHEFISAIREDRTPAVTGEDGYQALAITLAAYESAATGKPVRLD